MGGGISFDGRGGKKPLEGEAPILLSPPPNPQHGKPSNIHHSFHETIKPCV